MSPEEAICELSKYQFEDNSGAVHAVSEAHGHEILTAIKALQKQIPVQVSYHKKVNNRLDVYEYCPECNTQLILVSNYCSNCGQKLKWSGSFEVNHRND